MLKIKLPTSQLLVFSPNFRHIIIIAFLSFNILFSGCQKQSLTNSNPMKITSSNFNNSQTIPAKFTCQGLDISPELNISDVPEETKSLALIMDDPDAPNGTWVHWVIWNIDPKTTLIPENSIPHLAVQGNNSWPQPKYGGPCPPSGAHRYFFKLYALKEKLNLPPGSTKEALIKAMEGLIIDETQLMGIYKKTGKTNS